MDSMKKNALNTSFRSDTQATDSTRKGWMANTAATKALRHSRPGHLPQDQNSSIAVTACNRTLAR